MALAVRFDEYGGVDVLRIVEAARPVPGAGEVLVRVKAAGINPGEAKIRAGLLHDRWPATFPSGQGSDLAGIIEETGEEVLGFTHRRASHAEFAAVKRADLIRKPTGISWEAAGALFVAGTTAYAAVRAVSIEEGDVVVVAGAAGGVGSVAFQLAKNAKATVIGLASEANHGWLSDHGVIPIAYGEGVGDRIAAASGGRVDAFIDTVGDGYVDLALALGVKQDRINTIIDFAAAQRHGVKSEGNNNAASVDVLAELAGFVESGALEIPIARAYPLSEVREAYRELEQGHTRGKIVLLP